MSRRAPEPFTIAPLQRVIAEPITDPAEQAALDKLRKKRKQGARKKPGRRGTRTASGPTANK
jgi:hypothetical protein